jgi:signal transduction histidine kinase
MDIYEEILKTLSFEIVIWEQKNNEYICKFSNKKNNYSAQQGTRLDEYLERNVSLKQIYSKIFETKEEQHLTTSDQNIVLYRLFESVSDPNPNPNSDPDSDPDPEHNSIYYEVRTNIPKQIAIFNHMSYISNQIRGPLTTMLGSISELNELGLTPKQSTQIDLIEKSNFELISLANDIVDVINLSQNNIKLKLEFSNLKKNVIEAIEIVNSYLQKKKVTINFKLDKNIPHILLLDPQRLKQIIVNILTISLKNTNQGFVNISVNLFNHPTSIGSAVPPIDQSLVRSFDYVKVDPPKYNILFKIKDTSDGMSPGDVESIQRILGINDGEFKNYYNYEFTLIISKYLANLMCGNIWFENEPDFGVIYYFNIIA